MSKPLFQRPRGTYDIVPPDYRSWRYVLGVFETNSLNAGYDRISTPAFENTALFTRSVGEASEIVSKEMYTFEDKSGNSLSLRPEGTAAVVRAYLENGLASRPKPVKLYKMEPMWRYERPQAGRYRQFYQAGVEVFGSAEPLIDAQVISLAARFYRQLGIEYSLQINCLGNAAARRKYRAKLVDYLQAHTTKLPELVQAQLKSNPLRILDSKDPAMESIIAGAPQVIDYLDKASAKHFSAVLELLDNFGIAYELNPRLVRGLDYYTGPLFEFWGSHQGMQNAIGGGGRYDELVEELGGRPTPAFGFDLGVERILAELAKSKSAMPQAHPTPIYLVSIGEDAKAQAFVLEQELLDGGIASICELPARNLADQLARASKLKSPYSLIIGKKELLDQTVILKDMTSGTQEMVPRAKIASELSRRLAQ